LLVKALIETQRHKGTKEHKDVSKKNCPEGQLSLLNNRYNVKLRNPFRGRGYMCVWIFFTKFPFGCTPTSLSTTSPFLMNKIAGIDVIP
jgi:hypothetical protein